MSLNIHILNASGVFNDREKEIRSIVRSAYRIASRHLIMPDVDVVVQEALLPHLLEKMGGIGGYCPNAHYIEIPVDPNHKRVKSNLDEELTGSLLHEMHHAARWSSEAKFQDRLQDILVSEGLADNFVYELTGERNPWILALTKKDKERLKSRILKEQASEKYSYEDWFITGSKKRNIPRWTGYTIGWSIVRDYIEKTGKSAADLVATPSDVFMT